MNINQVNVNSSTSASASTAQTRQNASTEEIIGEKLAESQSRWDTRDTVEISEEATTWMKMKDVKKDISYTKEDLAPLKEKFAELQGAKKDINSKLEKLMSSNKLTLGLQDQLNVEINAQGKAVVGGVKDPRTARALEKAINEDAELLKEIKDYRKSEKSLSNEMKSVTGFSLKEYADRISGLQTGKIETITRDPNSEVNPEDDEYHLYLPTHDDLVGLKDQELYQVDAEFADMISKEYANPTSAADISGSNDILTHADSTVKGTVRDVIVIDVNPYLDDVNEGLRLQLAKGLITFEEFENSKVSLNNMTIHVDSEGGVRYEGTVCKDNKKMDEAVKEKITEFFNEEIQANPITGKEHDFTTASQYLMNQYENAFEEYDSGSKVEVTYKHGMIEAHLNNPEKVQEIKEEIVVEAKSALTDMGVDGEKVELEVDEKGKLVITNLDQFGSDAEMVEKTVDSLNRQVERRSVEDYHESEKGSGGPIKRVKGLLAHLDVYLPGGASKLPGIATDGGAG